MLENTKILYRIALAVLLPLAALAIYDISSKGVAREQMGRMQPVAERSASSAAWCKALAQQSDTMRRHVDTFIRSIRVA